MAILDLQLKFHWVWSLYMGSSYYVMTFKTKTGEKIISMREYNHRTVYYCFNNIFPVFGVSTTLNLPPISIADSFRTKNNPCITLIRFHIPFLLSLETLLVCWPTLLTTHKFLSWSMMILILNIPSCVTTLAVARWQYDTDPGFIMENMKHKIEVPLICVLY